MRRTKNQYDKMLTSPDGRSYWERNWPLFKTRSLSKQIPRKQRGEYQGIVWEGDALKGLGILDGDVIIVMRTPDIAEGDLVCTKERDNEEYFNLGVLSFDTGDDYVALTYPRTKQKRSETHPFLLRFVGRAVEVQRDGKSMAIQFRSVEATGVEAHSREIIEERLAA